MVVPRFVTDWERGKVEVDEVEVEIGPDGSLARARPSGRLGVKLVGFGGDLRGGFVPGGSKWWFIHGYGLGVGLCIS